MRQPTRLAKLQRKEEGTSALLGKMKYELISNLSFCSALASCLSADVTVRLLSLLAGFCPKVGDMCLAAFTRHASCMLACFCLEVGQVC